MYVAENYEKHKILSLKPNYLVGMSTEDIFKISGCLMEGHTEFYNVWHGNGWIDKGQIIRYPNLLQEITRRQSTQIKENFYRTNLIVGAAFNGSIIAIHVARYLNTLFAHTCGKGEDINFQKMFKPPKGLNVCFVEDIIFSGTDVSDHIKFFKNYGLNVEGISVWVNRQKDNFNGVKITSLIKPPFEYYLKENCPLCKNNIPILFSNIRE